MSASHAGSLAGGSWQTTAAIGRSLSQRRTISLADAQAVFPPPILAHYVSLADFTNLPADSLFLVFPSRSMSSWLLESSLEVGRSTVSARAERVAKHELFDPSDLRHSELFSVVKLSLGYLWELPVADVLRLGVGGVGSLHLVPDRLQAAYGRAPRSGQVFVRLRLGGKP